MISILNRKRAPKIRKCINIDQIDPVMINLANSIPLFMIQAGSQPVIRIDFIFKAGSWWQSKALIASSTNAMLSEGTTSNTGKEIANKLDYCGAYLNSSTDRDNAFITIYSLVKHLDIILPLAAEIIKTPSFPEQEFQTYKKRRKQNIIIEKSKVSNLAREKFAMVCFGAKHPYGRAISVTDFDNITEEDLHDFHRIYYNSVNCKIIASGRYNEKELSCKINELFGMDGWIPSGIRNDNPVKKLPSLKKQIFIPKKDAVQSAVRIGRELFNKKHHDYHGMMILNSILGGHFGSRLMQNIREKRGYTYGIGSALLSHRSSGFIVVISEIGTGYRKAAVNEIYNELNRLRREAVSKRELELTKNFMLGEILRCFDGPFAWAESIRNLVEHDLDTSFYRQLIQTIQNISSRELLCLAQKYLSPTDMYEVVAGKEEKPC